MTHSHQSLIHDIYPALLGQDLEHGHEGLQGGTLKVKHSEREGHIEVKRYGKTGKLLCCLVCLYFRVCLCLSLFVHCLSLCCIYTSAILARSLGTYLVK